MDTPKDISSLKSRTSSKWLGHDNILRLRFYKISNLDIADAMTDLGVIQEIANGKVYPIIVDIRELIRMTPKTKQYLDQRKEYPCINKAAFLVKQRVFNKLLGRLPQKIQVPGIESKCFTHEEDAINWLQS